MLKYKYVDFPQQDFDFSYCEKKPFNHFFDDHPALAKSETDQLKTYLTQEEITRITDDSYYFMYDSYEQSRATENSNLIPIDEYPWHSPVHGNSSDVIKQYLQTYQIGFSLLVGNNEYRTKTDKNFPHAHESTEAGESGDMTFTFINPVRATDEVVSKFNIFFVDVENGNPFLKSLTYPIPDDIISIDFPQQGQALLLYFDSTRGIHWVDGINNNNYMCHAFDSATLRRDF